MLNIHVVFVTVVYFTQKCFGHISMGLNYDCGSWFESWICPGDNVAIIKHWICWIGNRLNIERKCLGHYGLRRSSSMCRVLGRQSRGWLEPLVLWLFRLSMEPDDPEKRWGVNEKTIAVECRDPSFTLKLCI